MASARRGPTQRRRLRRAPEATYNPALMQLVNPAISEDLAAGKALRLDVGSGSRPKAGFYSLDITPGADIAADLNEPLHLLPDDCAEHVHSCHSLEHVERLVELMSELHRILRPGGLLEIMAPHFSSPAYYADPTHARPFALYTVGYFMDEADQPWRRKVPTLPGRAHFTLERIAYAFERTNILDRLFVPLFRGAVNRSPAAQEFYERRLSWIVPAYELRIRLRAKKPG
jgi:SAM-dependent methyltransferase